MHTLLLVEDDTLTRELLQLTLAAEGWQVTAVPDGEAAIAATAQGFVPQVLLTDLQLPGLSGAALAQQLQDSLSNIPLFFAMTATPGNATPAGFDALLQKPFAPATVTATAHRLWNAGAVNAPAQADGSTAMEPVLDAATLEGLRRSMSPAQVQSLYAMVLSDAETTLERMEAAAGAGDEDGLRLEAHRLKGSCGFAGALRLRAAAAAMETGGLRTSVQPILPESAAAREPFTHFRIEIAALRHMLETSFPDKLTQS